MSGLWNRVKDFVGFSDPVDNLEDFAEIEGQDEYQALYQGQGQRSGHFSTPPVGLDEEDNSAELMGGGNGASWRERNWRSEGSRRRTGEWSEPGVSSRERRGRSDRPLNSTMNNVIGLPNVNQIVSEVVVMEPRSFDEMAQVIQNLRDRKTVIMNLTLMDPADAQRSVDFVAGGTYAIDGHQERIGENIFLFTPSCVAVSTPSSTPVQIPLHTSMQTPTPIWSSSFSEAQAVGQR
ncbi:MAG: cell division protein SepF [Synechococcaceae cyanobacterium SM2_3_1]|nr:cell division protein SepF [Synechococcaceae cyanobacterium SM2_3_1]